VGRLARGRSGRRTLDSRTLRLTPTNPDRSCRLPRGLIPNRSLSRSFVRPGRFEPRAQQIPGPPLKSGLLSTHPQRTHA